MTRRLVLPSLLIAGLAAGGLAAAQDRRAPDAAALAMAKREAAEALRRSAALDRQARAATTEFERTRANAAAVAERIQAAEAGITAAETRIRMIEALRVRQRARLADRQGSLVRLTAALQTMTRRPAALALVQPGSLDDMIHVRSMLASTLPIIRERTADVRAEVEAGNKLRRQADVAIGGLRVSQSELRQQRIALARLEASQRTRSQSLTQTAVFESDRALALGERARDLGDLMGSLAEQSQVRRRLAALPGPVPRPPVPGTRLQAQTVETPRNISTYQLPVAGRLITGTGEISDGGVHARGLIFETRARAQAVAPAAGRIVYAAPFRAYGTIVIIDHGGDWTSLITNLSSASVKVGQTVGIGSPIGRAGPGRPRVSVELRHEGRPVAITPMLG